jgi:hypothetical protein
VRCARAPPPLLRRSNASPPQILAAFAPVPAAFQKQIYSVSEVEADKASKKVSLPGGIRRGGEARGHGGEEVPVRPITSCHPAAPVTVPAVASSNSTRPPDVHTLVAFMAAIFDGNSGDGGWSRAPRDEPLPGGLERQR